MSLDILTQVTLVLCAVLVGTFTLRRRSAAARHLVGVAGLVAALALPALDAIAPSWQLPILPPVATRDVAKLDRSPTPSLLASPLPRRQPRSETPEAASALRVHSAPAPLGVEARWPLVLIFAVWAAGTLAVAGRFAAGWWRMARLARAAAPFDCARTSRMVDRCCETLGLTTQPRLLTSPAVRVAAVWGVRRPVLWLPAAATQWTAGRLRVVLLHELAHLRRRDGLSLVVGKLCTAAWWFHPLSWIVDRTARRDCERACDDVVLSCGERPSSYAAHLLEIVRELPRAQASPSAALAMAGRGHIEQRLRSILHPGLPRGLERRLAVGAVSLLAIGVMAVTVIEPVTRAGGPDKSIKRVERRSSVDTEGDPSAGEAAFERAYEAHHAERFEDAVRAFEEAAAAGYRPDAATYNAACGLARLGRAEEAVRMLRRAVEEEGFASIELLFQDSDLDPVRRDAGFRELMDEIASQPRMRWSTARHDRYESAVERYEELDEEGSDDAEDWEEVGVGLLQLRDLERAERALERASEASGESTTLYNLACAYSLDGKKQQAFDALERAILAGFESDERMRNDTDLDALRDDPRFERLAELHWQLSLERFDRGWGDRREYSARRWAPAVEELRAFVAEHPDVGRAHSNLGWGLHFSGKHAEAVQAFTRQLELGYRPAIATYNIACAHAKLGELDRAFNWLGRAVETGEISPQQILTDPDLDALADDERLGSILERAAELNEDEAWDVLPRVLKWVGVKPSREKLPM